MPYKKWHQQAVKKSGPAPEINLYRNTLLFGLVIFVFAYLYTQWQGIPNPLNKSVADTSIILIGLSMLLTSLCYFWDFVDDKIIYRKHFGLIGFAFALVHIAFSYSALTTLFSFDAWFVSGNRPVVAGALATLIFTIMALISNKYAARELGGVLWRKILRTGYIGVALIWLHVYLLKSRHWVRWWNEGLDGPPSMSLIVTIFMTIVIVMRIALWISLKRRTTQTKA